MLSLFESSDYLQALVRKQLDSFFLIADSEFDREVVPVIPTVLKKVEVCFSANKNKYFSKNGVPYFNFYHSDQYAIFLYYLSNEIFRQYRNGPLCDRIYYLNKVMHAVDIYYEVELPSIFSLGHPVGTVLGRAKYSDFLSVSQNCTVGNNKGIYPEFGRYVTMFSGSKVLGKCRIGENVLIAANAYVKDSDIEDNSLVFGSSPNLIIKRIDRSFHESVWK